MSAPSVVRVRLKPGRDRSPRNHHPWVFSGAIAAIEGDATPGAVADLVDAAGEFVARGFVNTGSQIAFRAVTFRKQEVGRELLRERLASARDLRDRMAPPETDALRLVNAEGDRLPGLVVDRYGDFLVCQIGAAGMDVRRDELAALLMETFAPRGIWERSEGAARREEGLAERRGPLAGEEPPDVAIVTEQGVRLAVDVRAGHKTGFYLDQREGRALVRRHARGRRVLDAFAYTGAFSVNAVAGGAASVVAVDSSAPSLALVSRHLEANGFPDGAVERRTGDVFQALRQDAASYDLAIVDPPPFAKRKGEVEGACRGYKDVNLQAMKRLAPGGLLLSSSCSHHVDARLFQQVLFAAARDAGRDLQILERRGQPWDHPVSIDHPEGEYLKLFLLRAAG